MAESAEQLLKNPTITPKELAQVLRVSEKHARALIERGEVDSFRSRKLIHVPTAPLRRKLGMA